MRLVTAQISDNIRVGRRSLTIQGVRGGALFDPRSLGWKLTDLSTACWRGYIASYSVRRGVLVLTHLRVAHAWDSLAMKEPCFVVDVEDPSGRVERHEVFSPVARIGDDPGCTIPVPHETSARALWLAGKGFLIVSADGGFPPSRTGLADGATVAIGAHKIRPIIVAGLDAVYTAELPELAGRPGRWARTGMHARSAVYERLNIPVAFTGTLLACCGFLSQLYVHMGFHPAWKFEHVEELSFDAGRLTHHSDVSARLAEVRDLLAATRGRPPPGALAPEIEAWIARTFSLEY